MYVGCWLDSSVEARDWSVVVEYDVAKEFVAEGMEDIPVLTRKRCNTMPGTFNVPDDVTDDDQQSDNDGLSQLN